MFRFISRLTHWIQNTTTTKKTIAPTIAVKTATIIKMDSDGAGGVEETDGVTEGVAVEWEINLSRKKRK